VNDRRFHPPPPDVPSAGASVGPSCTAGSGVSCERPYPPPGRHRHDGHEARILRLFFSEAWPVQLIARELGLSRGCVLRAINRAARRATAGPTPIHGEVVP
jgi:hypothetical protein